MYPLLSVTSTIIIKILTGLTEVLQGNNKRNKAPDMMEHKELGGGGQHGERFLVSYILRMSKCSSEGVAGF